MYVVLASKSPRRLQLLSEIVPLDRIKVIPPKSASEAGFEGLETIPAIEARLLEIVRGKQEDVLARIRDEEDHAALRCHVRIVVAADTIVIVPHDAGGGQGTGSLVLGQPPMGHGADKVLKRWFKDYYVGKGHTVLTGFSVVTPEGESIERIVKSTVTFGEFDDAWIDWYIKTGEPVGKAGGYAIQGLANVLVQKIEGSFTSVIGLPLRELMEVIRERGFDVLRKD